MGIIVAISNVNSCKKTNPIYCNSFFFFQKLKQNKQTNNNKTATTTTKQQQQKQANEQKTNRFVTSLQRQKNLVYYAIWRTVKHTRRHIMAHYDTL